MKYHSLLVIFEKAAKFENCLMLQTIGGALRVNLTEMVDTGPSTRIAQMNLIH